MALTSMASSSPEASVFGLLKVLTEHYLHEDAGLTFTGGPITTACHDTLSDLEKLILIAQEDLSLFSELDRQLNLVAMRLAYEEASVEAEMVNSKATFWASLGGNRGQIARLNHRLNVIKGLGQIRNAASRHLYNAEQVSHPPPASAYLPGCLSADLECRSTPSQSGISPPQILHPSGLNRQPSANEIRLRFLVENSHKAL